MTDLSEYIKEQLSRCDSAPSEEIKEIISELESVQLTISTWQNRNKGDTWYAVQDFLDATLNEFDEAIAKAERILAVTEEEENEPVNYSDDEYKPVRM